MNIELLFSRIKRAEIKEKIYYLLLAICHYSGLKFIKRKFLPVDEKKLEKTSSLVGSPTGFLWAISIYIAFFGLASQRYENRVDIIENRSNALFSQIGMLGNRKFSMAGDIQNMPCPEKPNLKNPFSVFRSLFGSDTTCQDIVENLKGAVLDYKPDLSGYYLENINLQKTNLKETNFENSNLINAMLDSADLESVNLRGANLKGASLQGAYLRNANLQKATLWKANFQSANLNYTKIGTVNAEDINLQNATLIMADFHGGDLEKANFYNANLQSAMLRKARFENANFDSTNFEHANLQEADFINVKNLTAEQLIKAGNIYHLSNLPKNIVEDINRDGCAEMLNKTPDNWSAEFKDHRMKLLKNF